MDPNLMYFLLGVAIAIPLGIITNLATPRIEKWLINRPRISAEKKLSALQVELREVTQFYTDRGALYLRTISTIFTVLFYLAACRREKRILG
jgi:hypothetical protein